jgi:hypothetical protein
MNIIRKIILGICILIVGISCDEDEAILKSNNSIAIPSEVENIVEFINSNKDYNEFLLPSGEFNSSGIITRNNIVITRADENSSPHINGWIDLRGENIEISYLNWGENTKSKLDYRKTVKAEVSLINSCKTRALLFVNGKNAWVHNLEFNGIYTANTVIIWIGTSLDAYGVQNTHPVSGSRIENNKIKNWRGTNYCVDGGFQSSYIEAIQFGNKEIDVPTATNVHIRWNRIEDGPTTGPGESTFGNDAIVVADGPLTNQYNSSGDQYVNIEANYISGGMDAISIKANHVTVKYNWFEWSYSASSPGLNNRFGSFNTFEGNLVNNAPGPGIMIWTGDNLVFKNNVIRDCKWGIQFAGNTRIYSSTGTPEGEGGSHVLITNNTFVRNEINVRLYPNDPNDYAPHDDVVFINNIFYKKNGATSSVFVETIPDSTFDLWDPISYMGNNLFANGLSTPPSGSGSCVSCINHPSSSGVFDNVSLNNFDIETGNSPAVNSGRNWGWTSAMPTQDFEKKPRPVSTYDIGALEKNGY